MIQALPVDPGGPFSTGDRHFWTKSACHLIFDERQMKWYYQ